MEEQIKELTPLVDKIYNLSCILKEYCKNNPDSIEEIANIYPLAEYLHNNIDKLNAYFINLVNKQA